MIMKKIFLLFAVCLSFSFGNDFCVFDANGNCVSNLHDMREAQNVFQEKSFKKYYIASKAKPVAGLRSYKSVKPTKSSGHKRWYEVDWNQGMILCPEKEFNTGDGMWIVNGSARMDSKNCLYVDGSPYTRSILVLYARNLNDLTDADSSWILVNQTIVELAGKTFKIWDSYSYDPKKTKIRDVTFKQDLIVDKTELRIRDAIWLRQYVSELRKLRDVPEYNSFWGRHNYAFYPTKDTLEILDYPAPSDGRLTLIRSMQDRLEMTWTGAILKKSLDAEKNQNYFTQPSVENLQGAYDSFVDVLDTAANGYRYPSKDEWFVLQRGGAATIFAWGNDPDEKKLSRYMDINCSEGRMGVYTVRMFAPNGYGLYDVYGNAEGNVINFMGSEYSYGPICNDYDVSTRLPPVCVFMKKYACTKIDLKSVNHDLPYVKTFKGMRLVRKLE